MRDLSVLIPSRNEMFLKNTVEDILANIEADTEIIVVCDGGWPVETIADHPRVTLVHRPKSIGQRAATNEAARLSRARFIMKADAHCSFDKGFDRKLMADCEYDWTAVPRMYNLHVFDWMCKACQHRTYQGPTPTVCVLCGKSEGFERVIVWKRRRHKLTTSWRFQSDLHFQYFSDFNKRPEAQGEIADTMSLIGACFFMHRDRYWELGGSDEGHGSWGGYGTEISCKTWLSGGRLIVNKKTWFSHLFRTSGGDFSFPYAISGRDQEKARKHSRELWLQNKWPGQKYPLSALVEKFWPVPGWSEEDLARAQEAGAIFRAAHPLANPTGPLAQSVLPLHDPTTDERMPLATEVEPRPSHISGVSSQDDVRGVTASPVVANDMIKLGLTGTAEGQGFDQPGISKAVALDLAVLEKELPVSGVVQLTEPNPALGNRIDPNLRKEALEYPSGNVRNGEILPVSHDSTSSVESRSGPKRVGARSGPSILPQTPTKGIIYYTDNQCPDPIAEAVQRQLLRCANGHPIVSASLKPLDFGENIVIERRRGIKTMFLQILAALEKSTADVIFFAEHDVIYHPSHFDFMPPARNVFYYNENTWKVDAASGRALHYLCKQTSGLCAYRELLVEHYRKRIAKIDQNAADLTARGERVKNDGFSRHMGFEPGTHRYPRGVDSYKAERWMSEHPNVDIRHGRNLTPSRWQQSEFRNPDACLGWTESDTIPGWGKTLGRFYEWLNECK